MADSFEETGWIKLGVDAALRQGYAADARSMLALLARALERAMPGEATVQTKGLFGPKRVVGVTVQFGDVRWSLRDEGKEPLRAAKTKIVRGIALRSEDVDVAECLGGIAAGIESLAKRSGEDRSALAELLGLS